MRQTNIARPRRHLIPLTLLATAALSACQAAVGADTPDATTTYGTPVAVGNGTLRAYVTERAGAPVELGVAFTEASLEGLPATGAGHHGGDGPVHQYLLDFPTTNTVPFQFVEVNWNPMGHEPPGVYEDVPHLDFHFYTVSRAERDAIVPINPEYVAKANALPTGDFVPPFALQLGPPGASPADIAVPKMGVHWVDARAAELQQLLGKPEAYEPFTRTFIIGSWDGRFHFWEPMVARSHLLAKKSSADPAVVDEVIPISIPARYHVPGYYPSAYRITWDGEAREYRVALTGLARRQ